MKDYNIARNCDFNITKNNLENIVKTLDNFKYYFLPKIFLKNTMDGKKVGKF